jgi:hypothetical protein
MSIFDAAYDEMSWSEVCCRLPSDLAKNALRRRINDLDSMAEFMETVGSQPSHIREVKEAVNSVITNNSIDDIFNKFETSKHPLLFNWLNDTNQKRMKEFGKKYLTIEFLFNLTEPDDLDGMEEVLDRCLQENEISVSKLVAVLSKIEPEHFQTLLDTVLADNRPEVRVSILGIHSRQNWADVSDLQKLIAIKALAKCNPLTTDPNNTFYQSKGPNSIQRLNFNLFTQLKPLERLMALKKYFSYFPEYHKIKVFDPPPTKEEWDFTLFAGCIEHNDIVNDLNEVYQRITEEDPPKQEEDDEDDTP